MFPVWRQLEAQLRGMDPVSIAIIGAGPAGLALARILSLKTRHSSNGSGNAFTITVFERDTSPKSPHHRPQGGSLDLHPQSGQRTLKEAGLWEDFLKVARYDSQDGTMVDKHGKVLLKIGEERDKPEIGRGQLRELLLNGLDRLEGSPVAIRWDQQISRVEQENDGVSIFTGDSLCHGPFDLVIGADGLWSKVRPLLTATQPTYTGQTILETHLPSSIRNTHPEVAALAGKGMFLASGDGRALMAQYNPEYTRVYAVMAVDEEWKSSSGIDWTHPGLAKKQVVDKCFSDWAEQIKDLLLLSEDDEIRFWPLYCLPRPMTEQAEGGGWTHRRNVTMIGDAAHVMPPWTVSYCR